MPANRLISIDVLRAVTMLLMIFVNDVSGVDNIPAWIGHTEAEIDGMGFADTIFPAFLFIVGLSLPLAIQNRLRKANSFLPILLYIGMRSLALVVMGFFHVNLENYSAAAWLPKPVYTILLTLAFFAVWLDYQPAKLKRFTYGGIIAGLMLLMTLAFLFRGNDPVNLHPSWWGILGIIGWAYLVCALWFLVWKGRFAALLTGLCLLLALNIGIHGGWLQIYPPVIGDGSSATLVMGGAVVGSLYTRLAASRQFTRLLILLVAVAGLCITAGLLIRPFTGGISKINATPAWVLICGGITMVFFAGIIWFTDIRRQEKWFAPIKPAGTSTLTCYLIPYILYSVFELVHFNYPAFLNHGAGGILRSFAVAFFVVWVAGLLEKRQLRLKL